MADYQHINERDKIDIKCNCGNNISFRVASKANATMCPKCKSIILRSSIKIKDVIEKIRTI